MFRTNPLASLQTALTSSTVIFGLAASSVSALDIILVSHTPGSLQTFLEAEGHSVTAGAFTSVPDAASISAHDLIIIARETGSTSYSNEPGEAIAWNELPLPMVHMAPHIMRANRWAWSNSSSLSNVAGTTAFDPYPDPAHPFLADLNAPETDIFSAPITITSLTTALPDGTTTIATYGNSHGLFLIPEGAEMFASLGTAGAERVGFLRGNEDSWDSANPNAETILRNIIAYFDPIVEGDLDADGLDDNFEQAIIDADPNDSLITLADVLPGDDFDGDALTNQQEHDLAPRTDPTDADTDDDTYSDGEEVSGELNPYDENGALVGLPNGAPTNPNSADSDFDGASDQIEIPGGTDPNNADTDGDLMEDGFEFDNMSVANGGLDPLSDDSLLDPDDDGSNNLAEFNNATLPGDEDTDDDGSEDGNEELNFTDPLNPDSDSDGLLDGVETNTGVFLSNINTGTDPNFDNSDFDDFRDGAEVNLHNSDPTDADSVPAINIKTLFIGGGAAAPTGGNGDFLIMKVLEDRFGISQLTYQQGTLSASGDETGFNLIVISATNNSGDVREKFNLATIPVINWERLLNDATLGNFGLSSNVTIAPALPGVTSVNLIADHPITANLPSPLTIYPDLAIESYYSNSLGDGVTAIASGADGDALDSPMFMIAETGAALAPGSGAPNDLAPARRVFFPFDNDSWGSLSPDAFTLVGNAIDWAVGNETPLTNPEFIVSEIDYDSTTDPGNVLVTLSFPTELGTTYSIFANTDLASVPNEIEDSFESEGTLSTYTANFNISGLDATAPKMFFFVQKN